MDSARQTQPASKCDRGKSFKELTVWNRAVELGLAVYRLTEAFPRSEQFGLTNQLRRAAVSVASNIAEGYGRATRGEYFQFLGHARGSLCELQTQLIMANALHFGNKDQHRKAEDLAEEVSRMLAAIISKLRQ